MATLSLRPRAALFLVFAILGASLAAPWIGTVPAYADTPTIHGVSSNGDTCVGDGCNVPITFQVSKPSGTLDSDLLVAIQFYNAYAHDVGTPVVPTGFTIAAYEPATSTNPAIRVYAAAGNATAPYTFGDTDGSVVSVMSIAHGFLNVAPSFYQSGVNTSLNQTCNSVTPTVDNALLICGATAGNSYTANSPLALAANFTSPYNTSAGVGTQSLTGGANVATGTRSLNSGGQYGSSYYTTVMLAVGTPACTSPVYQGTWPQTPYPGWTDANGVTVNGDVQTGATGSNSLQLNVCSASSWNVVSNFASQGGSINAYPDTQYTLTGDKTVTQYNSLQTCFGESEPMPSGPQYPTTGGSEWDYAYDVWLNNHTGEDPWANDIEIMVWNDYTDTSLYPPAGSRAVTIDGVAYHMFQGGGPNEWIYTRDTRTTSGCFDMLKIMKDLADNGSATTVSDQGATGVVLSTSGMTDNAALQHLEYGVEISATYGTQMFQITNSTLTVS